MKDFSDDELRSELKHRNDDRANTPTPVEEPNWSKVHEFIVKGVEEAVKSGHLPKDFKHFVYEAALEAVYGSGFWKWRNRQSW